MAPRPVESPRPSHERLLFPASGRRWSRASARSRIVVSVDTVNRRKLLIEAVERLGGIIAEQTTVTAIESGSVATEPLAADVWDQIGRRARETFADHRQLVRSPNHSAGWPYTERSR